MQHSTRHRGQIVTTHFILQASAWLIAWELLGCIEFSNWFNFLGRKLKFFKFDPCEKKILKSEISKELTETFSEIGGLESAKNQLKVLLSYDETSHPSPKCVLLYGPSGTGKTMLAKAIANELKRKFIYLKPSMFFGTVLEETETTVQSIFSLAIKLQPSIIFIDHMESILGKHNVHGVYEDALKSFFNQLDELQSTQNLCVTVLATASNCNSLNAFVLNKFHQIWIPPPDKCARSQILKISMKGMHLHEQFSIQNLSEDCDTFNGYEINQVVNMVKKSHTNESIRMCDFDEVLQKMKGLEQMRVECRGSKWVSNSLFHRFKLNLPRMLSEEEYEISKCIIHPNEMDDSFSSIAGLSSEKNRIMHDIILPLESTNQIVFGKGILITGPAGSGKTLLAKAIHKECKAALISLKMNDIICDRRKSNTRISTIFSLAEKIKPSILFIDMIDVLFNVHIDHDPMYSRMMHNFLHVWKEISDESGILVLATAKDEKQIHPSVHACFDRKRQISIQSPSLEEREDIIKTVLKEWPLGSECKFE